MNKHILRIRCLFMLLTVLGWQGSQAQQDTTASTFSGNSPCGRFVRSLFNIPFSADYDRIKWSITLLQDAETCNPVSFKLNLIYGMQEQSRPGFVGGGTSKAIQGKWKVTKGTPANPDAVVYELNSGGKTIRFIQLGGVILHLLYADKSLMIGDAGWSYTLNKID